MNCLSLSTTLVLLTMLLLGGGATRPINAPITESNPSKAYQFHSCAVWLRSWD